MKELGEIFLTILLLSTLLTFVMGIFLMAVLKRDINICKREHNVYKCERVYIPVEEE